MGRDKATLSAPEGTWLDRAVARLSSLGAEPIWIAGGDPAWTPLGAQHVPDGRPGQGPLAGIEAAMQRSRAEGTAPWCLVLACDLPALRGEHLEPLLKARGPEVDALVAAGPSGTEPLIGLYHTRSLGPLEAFLDGGRRSARAFLESLGDRLGTLAFPPAALRNANTPQDLRGPDLGEPDPTHQDPA